MIVTIPVKLRDRYFNQTLNKIAENLRLICVMSLVTLMKEQTGSETLCAKMVFITEIIKNVGHFWKFGVFRTKCFTVPLAFKERFLFKEFYQNLKKRTVWKNLLYHRTSLKY